MFVIDHSKIEVSTTTPLIGKILQFISTFPLLSICSCTKTDYRIYYPKICLTAEITFSFPHVQECFIISCQVASWSTSYLK